MHPTVLTRASTAALVTLARARLGILGAAADTGHDALLQILITSASSEMATYLGWPFARQQYQLQVPGTGRRHLYLPPSHCVVPLDPESVTVAIDGDTVTDFKVIDPIFGDLYRSAGWTRSSDSEDPLNITLTWRSGWVLPDQVQTWAKSTTFAKGSWIRPTSPALSPLLFEVTSEGGAVTGAGDTEPAWPLTPGETAAVGNGEVTARTAEELPPAISDLAYVETFHRHANVPPGLASISADDVEASYFATQTGSSLCNAVRDALDRMKLVAA